MVKVFNFEDNPNEFSANTYVIGKINHSCIIVDIGSTKDDVIEYIDSHYEKIDAILLTHAHFDHIRGLPKLLKHYKNKYDIPVYLHPADKDLLSDPRMNASLDITGEKVSMTISTIPVEDGEELELGKTRVKVIHTPFHTMGSVCYLFDDDNALFTGDTLFKGSIGRTDLAVSDPNQVPYSLEKLRFVRDTLVVYPGHGPISRLDTEFKTNPYLR